MDLETIVIQRRFLGPPNSANGGYACGRIAAHIEGPGGSNTEASAAARYTPRGLPRGDDGAVILRAGERAIGFGRGGVAGDSVAYDPQFVRCAQRGLAYVSGREAPAAHVFCLRTGARAG